MPDYSYSGSQKSDDSPMPYALCPMPYALCPMPYALCPMPYALCPMPYPVRVPHLSEKGYSIYSEFKNIGSSQAFVGEGKLVLSREQSIGRSGAAVPLVLAVADSAW